MKVPTDKHQPIDPRINTPLLKWWYDSLANLILKLDRNTDRNTETFSYFQSIKKILGTTGQAVTDEILQDACSIPSMVVLSSLVVGPSNQSRSPWPTPKATEKNRGLRLQTLQIDHAWSKIRINKFKNKARHW